MWAGGGTEPCGGGVGGVVRQPAAVCGGDATQNCWSDLPCGQVEEAALHHINISYSQWLNATASTSVWEPLLSFTHFSWRLSLNCYDRLTLGGRGLCADIWSFFSQLRFANTQSPRVQTLTPSSSLYGFRRLYTASMMFRLQSENTRDKRDTVTDV